MLKVTYNTSNLFTLKKYKDSNLNCQSYVYPTIYSLRSAILGAIIQLDGIEKAQELFHKVKNAIIYVQYPDKFKVNGIKIKRFTNKSYNNRRTINLNSNNTKEHFTEIKQLDCLNQMGFREYVHLEKHVFYIDKSIPDIQTYLKNIDWLGTAESLVYLSDIEETNSLENVMRHWNATIDEKTYEQYDWDKKMQFENIYMYSPARKHLDKRINTYIGDLHI